VKLGAVYQHKEEPPIYHRFPVYGRKRKGRIHNHPEHTGDIQVDVSPMFSGNAPRIRFRPKISEFTVDDLREAEIALRNKQRPYDEL